jgi:hypothetical protein
MRSIFSPLDGISLFLYETSTKVPLYLYLRFCLCREFRNAGCIQLMLMASLVDYERFNVISFRKRQVSKGSKSQVSGPQFGLD